MRLSELGAVAVFQVGLRTLLALGFCHHAQSHTERRLRVAPDDAHALATLAQLQAESGDLDAAAGCLRRLLAIRPDQATAWFNLGYVLEQQGQATAAEAAFRRATEADDRLDRAWYGLALSLIAQQRWDEAEAALHRTNELQPLSPFGWVQLARLHMKRREPEKARDVIDHLRGFEPKAAARLAMETGLDADALSLAGGGGGR